MTATDGAIFYDHSYGNRWKGMLAGVAPGEELELTRVKRIVCAGASAADAQRHGESWLGAFLSFCERGRIGSLQSHSDGSYTLVLSDPLPSGAEAWERIEASWPELG